LPRYKHDGTVRASRVDDGKSITVRVPEQIYILGSKKDVEGFKNFVSNKKPDSLEITGNAVSQNPSYNSFLGIGLFLIGLAGFYLVKKNK
jgi:LPXTG-motif cell wall-anchored protein